MTRQAIFLSLLSLFCHSANAAVRPNVVIILADDLGYGDLKCLNSEGKIATPHLDRLAREGMIFTDAHSGSAVCTPTRYGLVTGRYAWRTRLKSGVLGGYSRPLIERGRPTIGTLAKQRGYATACVGKWHMGMDIPLKDGGIADDHGSFGKGYDRAWDVDYAGPIKTGPNSVGFDYYFGISASLDMSPYLFIKNDRFTEIPTREKKIWRSGPAGDDFEAVKVLPELTEKAVAYIDQQAPAARDGKPFLLYFPLNAPHAPVVPSDEWRGKSGINDYADFVMQVDDTVGRVLAALDAGGIADDTLLFVTSDNGCSPTAGFKALAAKGHFPSYHFRGYKADIFDGGHRVPFIARWPAKIAAGSQSDQTICLTDFMATLADVLDVQLPRDAGEDSVSILPALLGEAKTPLREAVVHHSINGSFAIRQGDWKLELCRDSGGWSEPRPGSKGVEDLPDVQLYNLASDIGERQNVHAEHPEIVARLTALLQRYRAEGRSTGLTAATEPAADRSAVVAREFIYETAPFPECHASTLAETKDTLVAAWFGGTREKHEDVGIWLSRKVAGKWSEPVEVANGVEQAGGEKPVRYPTWNPVLFQPKAGPLLLFYKVGPSPSTWWGMMTTSADGGKTWSRPRRLPDGILGPIKNKPIELAGGELLCPSSTESAKKPGLWQAHFERTSDLGRTWETTGPVNDGERFSAIQPSILTLAGGKLQALGRTRQGNIFQVTSDDGGKTWGEMTSTALPNPNSGIDAVTLRDGRHLVVYNHTRRGRSPLNVAISRDAADWWPALVLESQPGEYSYPAVIQTADGLVHVTYTWQRKRVRHVVLDPANLKRDDKPSLADADLSALLKTFRGEFVAITPGKENFPASFSMGDARGTEAERPPHTVSIAHGFAMARYEVPQNLWEAVMGKNPSRWKGERNSVEMLTHDDAVDFCRRVTAGLRRAKLIADDEVVRLPTEAEWEYAARAGSTTRYSFGDDASALNDYGWHHGNAAGNDPPVGAKRPNAWTLYDMHGYLWEWCADHWHDGYAGAPKDGSAWISGGDVRRVLRGGSWKDPAERLTSACRQPADPTLRDDAVGLRCVLARDTAP